MFDDFFGVSLRIMPVSLPRSARSRSVSQRWLPLLCSTIPSLCLLGILGGTAWAVEPVTLASASAVPAVEKPLLKAGSQGTAVTELQAMLKLMSFYQGPVTGVYDEPTAAAVTQFQKAANLTPDGIVGAETWNRLLPPAPSASAPPPQPTPPSSATADTFPTPGQATPTTPSPTPQPTPKPAQPPAKTATGTPAAGSAPTASDSAAFPILRMGMRGPAVEGLQHRLRGLGFLKGEIDGVFGPETQTAVKAAQQKLKLEPDGIVGNATWQGLLR